MATLTVQTPDRSIDQRMAALARANEVRSARARLKRELKAGRSVLGLLTDPPDYTLTMKVMDLLLAVPKVGRVKAMRMLARAQVSPSKTVGGMSPRQRCELGGLLRERGVR